ncbi:MAG: hypothetical protein HRU34_07820 [Richelia sp.]|nr:hypothetical protein [Richelia sp.]CDN14753.1 hypothetical protein RintRC_0630 [Richelia intracellularis]
MDANAKLLNELKAEYEQSEKQPASPQQLQKQSALASTSGDNGIDKLLSEVKADFAQKDLAQELQKQEKLEQERIKQEQVQAQELDGSQQKAEDWLNTLDPFFPEELWFERFAEKYASKLAAA